MNDFAVAPPGFSIVDAHAHLYDSRANVHGFLERIDDVFEALVGDYSALPRSYLPDAYLADTADCKVQGIVWHEFLSDDALKEVQWGQHLAQNSPVPQAMVALVDFLDPGLDERLQAYRSLPNVTAVREHVGWDTSNPRRRFAKRSDLLTDPAWRLGIASLRKYDFRCGLEVFAPQTPQLLEVIRQYPDLGFTLAVMGWPLDLSPTGFTQWQKDIRTLSECENVCASISAIECVFGMDWTEEKVAPWVLSLIDMFGPGRCMFGSHLPIARVSRGFSSLFEAYRQIVRGFSLDEQDQLFRKVAADWFRLR
jgi:predicted TIM-barrel fold metal-dependent hydrolase